MYTNIALSDDEKVQIALSNETTEKRKYLQDFNKRLENSGKDHYIEGMKEDSFFWEEIYTDKHMEEDGTNQNVKPRIGPNYQVYFD